MGVGASNRVLGSDLMKAVLIVSSLMLASLPILSIVAADEGCDNYGVQNQISVTGSNTYSCKFQHCEQGAAGAGSAGVGVGTAGGAGNGGAQASAGSGCKQDTGGESSDGGAGLGAHAVQLAA